MLIKGEDALYPQNDLPEKLASAMKSWEPWLREEAEKKLADPRNAADSVVEHWNKLAKTP